jgi:hypothetical protein
MPDNPNLPSEFVAAEYFFPVNVLAAVTLTPGSGVLPLRAEPLISYAGVALGGAAGCGVCAGEGGAASCASKLRVRENTMKQNRKKLRAIDFKSGSP